MIDTKQIKPKRTSSSSFFFKVSLEGKTHKSDVTFAAATTFQTWTQIHTVWWYTYTSEKYDFASWDDYSQHMEKYPLVNVYQATNRLCHGPFGDRRASHFSPIFAAVARPVAPAAPGPAHGARLTSWTPPWPGCHHVVSCSCMFMLLHFYHRFEMF